MKPKTMILMIVAVGCGLGASIMTSRLLAERRDKDQGEATVPVLVAKGRVVGWTEIKDPDKMFEIKQFPVSLAPKAPVGEIEKLKGKKLNKNIVEGYALTEADLLNKEQQGIDVQLLPGQRATAIKVNAQSLAGGFVLPGSRVDITLVTKNNGKSTCKTILQHVLVMAVDNKDTRNTEERHIIASTVTVAATPQEAGRLALASSLGELALQLKGPGESALISPVTITEADLDRPITPTTGDKPTEVARTDTGAVPTIVLPALPADEKKDEEKPRDVLKVTPVQTEEAPKKTHVMRIQTGATVQKVRFLIGEKDPDEDADPTPTGPAPAKPAKPEEKADPVGPATTKTPAGPAKVGRTRN
jgi:pilus assembly protein CpaB